MRPGGMAGTASVASGRQRTKAPNGAASRRSEAGSEVAGPRFSTSISIATCSRSRLWKRIPVRCTRSWGVVETVRVGVAFSHP